MTAPGRPRDPRTRQAIVAAARRQLAEDGYDRVSVESIAREAGVGKPTVYRRWPSKAHVVFDAVFGEAQADTEMFSDTGDFEADLRRFVRAVFGFWGDPVVAAATMGILAERHRDPELSIRAQQLLDERTRAGFATLVAAGVRRGVLAAEVDAEMLYHLLVATGLYATQVLHTDHPDAVVDRLCALVLQGARARTEGAP
ncbi:TetR/AcrR family transcriptional regulator [Mycolicibacterium palauense]|uniref:TetR/AcrR family transcriptional regulator n=1 Tax=Mycolicibacterium palauense TaxID=2034511 RepID=UPI000BFEE292|nr:TetR/AcrR family transcriptional regulator [Mycolicibacterium palauense]